MSNTRLYVYFEQHVQKLNLQILWTSFIFLALSVSWNVLFLWMSVPYSRADIPILISCLVLCVVLIVLRAYVPTQSMKHLVVSFTLLVFVGLYFGSGFSEAWAYFLITPIIAGLYGGSRSLLGYSTVSFIILWFVSVYYPLYQGFDSVDISNRLLCHIIITTFSYMVIRKLQNLYSQQLQTIEESAEKMIEQVVKTFVVSVEAKDIYTFGHSERVSKYAVALASQLPEYERDEQKLHHLHLMGLLHDIGKINIAEEVLCKSTSLTEEEYELIKTHPVVGARMIEKIEGLESLKTGVLYHHERWDGEGYPTQAKGKDIPLAARILAIADGFDAMTSSRAYRAPITPGEAYQGLLAGRGTQYDPDLIDRLEAVKLTWFQIYRTCNDDLDELENIMDLH